MYQVSLDEARARLLDLIEAALRGEDVFILGEDRRLVQLVPVEMPRRRPRFGSARGLVMVADDFDAPLTDFNSPAPPRDAVGVSQA